MGEREQVIEIIRKVWSPPFKAVMGRGDGVVVVDGRPGYVWCRKLGKTEMLMEAYNRGAPNIEDVIVLVQESRIEGVKGYEVIGVASSTSPDNYYPEVPPHAWTHEWRPGIGRDRVTVYPRTWGYLRAEPIPTGSAVVWVTPGWYYYDGFLRWYAGGYSPPFGGPPSGTWYQLLSFDPTDESLHVNSGNVGMYGYAAVPAPTGCTYSIALVESTGTFSSVTENMIEDVRLFMDPIVECGDLIVHDHENVAGGGLLDHGLAHTPASLLDDDHTQYFLADCTRAFGGDPIPDGADTRSLGSATAEWRNVYVGDVGKIYFGLGQDISLGRGAVNRLDLGAGDTFRLATTDKIEWRDTAIYIHSSADGYLDLVADISITLDGNTFLVDAANNRVYIADAGLPHANLDAMLNISGEAASRTNILQLDIPNLAAGEVWLTLSYDAGANDYGYIRSIASGIEIAGGLTNTHIVLTPTGTGGVGIGKIPSYLLDLNLATEDFAIEDAGSAGATEQDWVKVRVGGVAGYLHVFAAV